MSARPTSVQPAALTARASLRFGTFTLPVVVAALLACAGGARGAYIQEVLADNPLVYLRFEETSGSAFTNAGSLGPSHGATGMGGVTPGQPGAIASEALNHAVLLDGTDDHVLLDNAIAASNFANSYSIELWFKANLQATRDLVAGTNAANLSQHGILLEARSDGLLRYLHRAPPGTGGGQNINPSAQAYTSGESARWHHLVAVLDKVGDARAMKLYLDGNLDPITATAAADIDFDLSFVLGQLGPASTQRRFSGLIDEFALYNYALDNPNADGSTADSRVGVHLAAAVPEPAGLLSAALGGLLLSLRRPPRER